jgi:cell division topological specificity factor
MTLFNFLSRKRSAPLARERLQILLTHERGATGQADLISILREEVLAVIAKHVTVEPDKVDIKLERGQEVSILEIDVEIPNAAARAHLARTRSAA